MIREALLRERYRGGQAFYVVPRIEDLAGVKDFLEKLPEPKPAYNTVSTIVRLLEKKGFVGYTAYGKTHEYYPLVTKEQYSSYNLKNLVSGYFGGSFEKLVSFFAKEKNMDIPELEEMLKHVSKEAKALFNYCRSSLRGMI